MQTELTKPQQKILKAIVSAGKTPIAEFDKRKLRALDNRKLIKVTSNKKGEFVQATAAGKKALN
jgi:hypothetical protein